VYKKIILAVITLKVTKVIKYLNHFVVVDFGFLLAALLFFLGGL
jgi:hypothetical protein